MRENSSPAAQMAQPKYGRHRQIKPTELQEALLHSFAEKGILGQSTELQGTLCTGVKTADAGLGRRPAH